MKLSCEAGESVPNPDSAINLLCVVEGHLFGLSLLLWLCRKLDSRVPFVINIF